MNKKATASGLTQSFQRIRPNCCQHFQRLLPTSAPFAVVTNAPGKFYRRTFTPLVILWGFVHQQLGENRSCDSVLVLLSNGALDEWDSDDACWLGNTAVLGAAQGRLTKVSTADGTVSNLWKFPGQY